MSELLLLVQLTDPTTGKPFPIPNTYPRLRLLVGATSGTSEAISFQNAHKTTFSLQFDGTVAAGQVTVESSRDPNFTGAWADEGTVNAASNSQFTVVVDGGRLWVRVRIGTPITGGATLTAEVESIGK